MTADTGGMFGKYLRREHGFRRLQPPGPWLCYFKHAPSLGGIYAYIEQGVRGVLLVVNQFARHFEDFLTLSAFLHRLDNLGKEQDGLVNTLLRSSIAKHLRTITI